MELPVFDYIPHRNLLTRHQMPGNHNPWEIINTETLDSVKRKMEFGHQGSNCFTHLEAWTQLLQLTWYFLQAPSAVAIDSEYGARDLFLEQQCTRQKPAKAWGALNQVRNFTCVVRSFSLPSPLPHKKNKAFWHAKLGQAQEKARYSHPYLQVGVSCCFL